MLACHAGDPGSIPGRDNLFFFWYLMCGGSGELDYRLFWSQLEHIKMIFTSSRVRNLNVLVKALFFLGNALDPSIAVEGLVPLLRIGLL